MRLGTKADDPIAVDQVLGQQLRPVVLHVVDRLAERPFLQHVPSRSHQRRGIVGRRAQSGVDILELQHHRHSAVELAGEGGWGPR